MTDPIVPSYFRSHQSSLFLWTDEGQVLSWMGGTTIAFRQELVAVVERLSNGSLPAFQSIIVAVAVTRNNWLEISERLTRLVRALNDSELPTYASAMQKHRYLTETWPATSRRLLGLSKYAESNVRTAADRAELLATLFDGFESSYSTEQQAEISAAFQAGLPEDWFFERKGDGEQFSLPSNDEEEAEWRRRPPLFHRILHDVLEFLRIARVLASNLHDWKNDDLQRRIQTGVTEDIEAPESPLEPTVSAHELLTSLQDDADLFGFARIARRLMAAVSLPRSLDTSREFPTGGISDISNRGQLDQLLLSELAFDDLTLAIRVTTNEAMYIRRESPPSPQTQSRPVLIDTSLPLWGIPKLYATAMAMALAAQNSESFRVDCFRAEGQDVVPVPLNSKEDICTQLSVLSPTEHPGMALAAFQQEIDTSSDTTEPVVITTGDVITSSAFQHLLSQTDFRALWVIQVERDGRLQVMQRTCQGTSIRKKIHLAINEILSEQAASSLTREDVAADLPDILQLKQFPLRLSHQLREARAFCWDQWIVSFTNDGRMLLWDRKRLGAIQLCDDLNTQSKRPPLLIARSTQMIQFMLTGSPCILVSVRRLGLKVERVEVAAAASAYSPIAAVGETVFLHRFRDLPVDELIAVNRSTGKLQASLTSVPSNVTPGLGRIFRVAQVWSILCVDGTGLHFQSLPTRYQSAIDILEYDVGQYLLISPDGKIHEADDAIRFEHSNFAAVRFVRHLPGSRRIWVADATSKLMFELGSGRPASELSRTATPEGLELAECLKICQLRTPHWKFCRVGLEATAGRIRLQTNKGADFVIWWNAEYQRIELVQGGEHDVVRLSAFNDQPRVGKSVNRLQQASWDGGNRAWLDSRGLLHLRSENREVPQVTLVLRDGPLSGWLSSGEVFGEDYYVGPLSDNDAHSNARITPADAWKKCIKPFLDSGPWSFHYSFDTTSVDRTQQPHC